MKSAKKEVALEAIFLGTNGWFETNTGATICVLIRTAEYNIIFDAGSGLAKTDRYITDRDDKPVFIFLSHFHLGHIMGLNTLAKFRFSGGLSISGPTGTKEALRMIINSPYMLPISQLPYPAKVYELPEEKTRIPFRIETRALRHASLTIGFRIEIDGKAITYCPDTVYCSSAVDLARSCDLLIAECSFKRGQVSERRPHLNPETAARIALEAGAKKLALVHFDAQAHPFLADRQDSENAAREIFKNAFATRDDMRVEI